MKKEEKITISVHTYTWGPCVIKLKIQDDFKKALIKHKKLISYRHNLMLKLTNHKEVS